MYKFRIKYGFFDYEFFIRPTFFLVAGPFLCAAKKKRSNMHKQISTLFENKCFGIQNQLFVPAENENIQQLFIKGSTPLAFLFRMRNKCFGMCFICKKMSREKLVGQIYYTLIKTQFANANCFI